MAKVGMSNLLEANGLRLGYTARTVTVTEPATGFKIVFNNDGTVRSNTFPMEGIFAIGGGLLQTRLSVRGGCARSGS